MPNMPLLVRPSAKHSTAHQLVTTSATPVSVSIRVNELYLIRFIRSLATAKTLSITLQRTSWRPPLTRIPCCLRSARSTLAPRPYPLAAWNRIPYIVSPPRGPTSTLAEPRSHSLAFPSQGRRVDLASSIMGRSWRRALDRMARPSPPNFHLVVLLNI